MAVTFSPEEKEPDSPPCNKRSRLNTGRFRSNLSPYPEITFGNRYSPPDEQVWEWALKATDLLLRDRNFPLVILDLALNPAQQLRRIPSSTWYRLQRIVESSGTTFVVVTPQAMVGCAQVRMNLNGRFALDDLMEDQDQLVGKLKAELTQYRLKISDIAEKKAATAS
jgi:hypothetical protein